MTTLWSIHEKDDLVVLYYPEIVLTLGKLLTLLELSNFFTNYATLLNVFDVFKILQVTSTKVTKASLRMET